jgi:hypothetical protein
VIDTFVFATEMTRKNVDGRSYGDLLNATFEDLLKTNFCPIHSFMVDRSKISEDDLRFDARITRLEDYDFLLRVCSKYPISFATFNRCIGVYNYDIAGGNSVMHDLMPASTDNIRAWQQAQEHIFRLKSSIRMEMLRAKSSPLL